MVHLWIGPVTVLRAVTLLGPSFLTAHFSFSYRLVLKCGIGVYCPFSVQYYRYPGRVQPHRVGSTFSDQCTGCRRIRNHLAHVLFVCYEADAATHDFNCWGVSD
jgi:hypothetical protein